jgi:hypothetical protein
VPAASLKHLGKYIQEIGSISAGGRKVDICDVTTRIFFHKEATGILGFTAAGWVNAASQAVADQAYESKVTDALVGKNDQPYTGEIGVLPAAQPSQERRLPPPFPTANLDPEPAFQSVENMVAHGGTPGTSQEPKKRGRPRKEPVQEAPATQAPFLSAQPPAGNGTLPGAPSPGEIEDVPDFLKRIESAPGMPPNTTTGSPHDQAQIQRKPAGPSFGMQSAQAAPEDMAARIAAVLAMKTGS